MGLRSGKTLAFALAACVCGEASAIFGINTNPATVESGFPYVGQVNGGGGVVFAPHWVASASHLGLGDFVLNGVTYHPDFHVTRSDFDTTIYHFSTTFSDVADLYSGPILGKEITMVGYGFSGTQRADHLGYNLAGSQGVKRSATNTVGQIGTFPENGGTFHYIAADLDTADPQTPGPYSRDQFGDGGPTANEGGVAGGDSGGGWFVSDGGVMKLAGIINFSLAADDAPKDQGPANLLYGYGGSGAADFTEGPVRDWVDATLAPEPKSIVLAGFGLVAIVVRRYRTKSIHQ